MNRETEKIAWSVAEFAEAIGVSKPIAYQIVHIQSFPVIKAGTKFLIPIDGAKQWVEDQAKKHAAYL